MATPMITSQTNKTTGSDDRSTKTINFRVMDAMQDMEKAISELTHIEADLFKVDSDTANTFQKLANKVQAAYAGMDIKHSERLMDILSQRARDKIEVLCKMYNIQIEVKDKKDEYIEASVDTGVKYNKSSIQALYQALSYKSQTYTTAEGRDQHQISSTYQMYNNAQNIISSMLSRWSSVMNALTRE